MRKIVPTLFLMLFAVVAPASAQTLAAACRSAGMNCEYNARYELIDQLYHYGRLEMFSCSSNSYTRNMCDSLPETNPPRWYIGSADQNARLARNIMANRHLFRNGLLRDADVRLWRLVE